MILTALSNTMQSWGRGGHWQKLFSSISVISNKKLAFFHGGHPLKQFPLRDFCPLPLPNVLSDRNLHNNRCPPRKIPGRNPEKAWLYLSKHFADECLALMTASCCLRSLLTGKWFLGTSWRIFQPIRVFFQYFNQSESFSKEYFNQSESFFQCGILPSNAKDNTLADWLLKFVCRQDSEGLRQLLWMFKGPSICEFHVSK